MSTVIVTVSDVTVVTDVTAVTGTPTSPSPSTSSGSSANQNGLSTESVWGIFAVVVSLLTISLAVVLSLYIMHRRNHGNKMRKVVFQIVPRRPQGDLSSNVNHNNHRREPEIKAPTQTDNSLVALVSSLISATRNHTQPRQQNTHTVFASEELFLELQNNARSLSMSNQRNEPHTAEMEVAATGPVQVNPQEDDEHARSIQSNVDSSASLVGGAPGAVVMNNFDQFSMSDGSTLPPSYFSRLEEV
ncbi:hypothetical protein V8D89_000957 [Ganoderma adspersum]